MNHHREDLPVDNMPASRDGESEATPVTPGNPQNNNNKASKPVIHVTFSENNIEHLLASEPPRHSPSLPTSFPHSPSTSSSDQVPILKKVHHRSSSMESHDNPFTQEGELHQKADFILKHSTISRTEVRISDPDGTRGGGGTAPEQIEMMEAQTSSPVHAAPPPSDVNGVSGEQTKLNDKTKVNGQAEADGSADQPKDTKKKKGKAKCCVVQ